MVEVIAPPIIEKPTSRKLPELIHTPREFYADLAQSIRSAKKSIDLEFFTYEHDKHLTKPVFDALHDVLAQNPDIQVRIYPDHRGISPLASFRTRLAERRIKKDAKGHIEIVGHKNIFHKGGSILPTDALHKKLAVIDAGEENGVAYIGGMNLSGRHADFADLMIKLHEPHEVDFVARDFERTWHHQSQTTYAEKIDEHTTMHALEKGKGDSFAQYLSEKIGATQKGDRIFLETSYPDKGILRQALIAAHKRDVEVVIIVPHPNTTNDLRFRLYPRRTTKPLVENGLFPLLYVGENASDPEFDHTKILLINDTAFVGSHNFTTDPFSGGRSEELVMETTQPETVKALEERFLKDRELSKPYEEVKQQQTRLRRFMW